MDQATHNKIGFFIWGIADDVLRNLFKRGKYPDVPLPMCAIHFYKPKPLRTLAELSADILAIKKEADGLLDGLLVHGEPA